MQILATPAIGISWAPDGKSFVYQDVKGFEDNFRKHHTSAVTRDIWRYTPATGKHTLLVGNAGEDLSPVDAGNELYFISERAPQKSLNVYKASAANPADAKAITSFKKHPVRFLSRANNGTIAFTYDGEIYTLAAVDGAKPSKVKVISQPIIPMRKLRLRQLAAPVAQKCRPMARRWPSLIAAMCM